ncbi:hypothetical protein A1O1_02025 [Capronia coronata CBS 617.96]|uniref:SCP domain-containing protein n=1 Tax=Capronia coronata CBS 617.96 TaxID=1182541 RepID=W9YM44_9EURO|nr:uncharacterized protein A1O1_02025 [Capronia coronata CBS 617.96]EXJ93633.1 hypothetical protein A1O1_02025 [Capronia coronata CBS 617.96]
MKTSSFIVAAACASLAAATPLNKRAWATTYEIVTVTVTVTGSPPAETAVSSIQAIPTADATSWAAPNSGHASGPGAWWGAWRDWGSISAIATTWATQSAVTTIIETSAAATATASASAVIPTYATPSSPVGQSSANAVVPTYATPSSSPAGQSSASAVVPTYATTTSAPVSQSSANVSPTLSSSTAAAVPTTVSSDYQQGILDSHNIHRRNATVSNLVWSDEMASIAAQIASSCVYAHDTSAGGGGYGQNIGAGAPPSDIPAMITDEMYNGEINYYPAYGVEPDMSNFEKWGHYSQIVWKSTTSVGCATQYCPNGLANTGSGVSPYFTVCNYSPPGNFGGQYAVNVLQPQGLPTVTL